MPGIQNLPKRAVGVTGNALKATSSVLRILAGNFTEGALIVIFAITSVVVVFQKHYNVALYAFAATLGLTAMTNTLSAGLVLGLFVISADYFLRLREPFANPDDGEEEEESPKPKRSEIPPPDHGDRTELLELGKKYKLPSKKHKLPSEDDDKDFHLDAGSTFLNAYKSLKPDQLAAMTKDTQDLMQTQKQLMSTLQTLKPLIMDGKEMMNTFQSYFGSSAAPAQ
jgi:hypothetical protein